MGVRSARVVVRAKDAVVSEYSISIPDHRNGTKDRTDRRYMIVLDSKSADSDHIHLFDGDVDGDVDGGEITPLGCDLVFIQRTLSMVSMFL